MRLRSSLVRLNKSRSVDRSLFPAFLTCNITDSSRACIVSAERLTRIHFLLLPQSPFLPLPVSYTPIISSSLLDRSNTSIPSQSHPCYSPYVPSTIISPLIFYFLMT
jgi:hypothetical protein